MNTSVGTKAGKKQPSLSTKPVRAPADASALKIPLLTLENACMRVLESDYESNADPEHLYWQQRLMNIAKPVSLALAELGGPRHFHNHYRHRENDASVLHPVLEDPVTMLAQVCLDALKASRRRLAGMQDESLIKARNMLESALQGFLAKQHLSEGIE